VAVGAPVSTVAGWGGEHEHGVQEAKAKLVMVVARRKRL
jgi:hypothetical protein